MNFTSRFVLSFVICCAALSAGVSRAIEYKVEALNEAPPADALSPAIVSQLQPTGFKVVSGTGRTLVEVWPCKEWPVKAGFTPTSSILYPFEMGQLLGAVRYQRKGGDFRGQEIAPAVYTLRYSLQPEDGNHVGTSDTRDFGVLLPAADDKQPGIVAKESLFKLSAKAAGTSHPCMLSLRTATLVADAPPVAHHEEEHDLWILGFAGKSTAGGKTSRLPVDLVVVGKAAE